MPIKNLSDVRRLPRLGKIALGVKKTASSGKEYPTEVDYFVVPEKVSAVFGDKPKELRIMFPVSNAEVFFQQWYKCYGTSALKCKGDGEKAFTWDEDNGGMKEIPCPCPKLEGGECKQIGTLQFLLPDVAGAGVWQITTSSKNSIIDINSSLDFIKAVCGRVHMVPLILKREKNEMTRTEGGKPKKSTHYTLKIDLDGNATLRQLQEAAQKKPEVIMLPPADETRDDLLYPENGFKPEEDQHIYGAKTGASTIDDIPGGEGEPEISDETKRLAVLRDELAGVIAECEKAGMKLKKEGWAQVQAIQEEAEYGKAIEHFRAILIKKTANKEADLF